VTVLITVSLVKFINVIMTILNVIY